MSITSATRLLPHVKSSLSLSLLSTAPCDVIEGACTVDCGGPRKIVCDTQSLYNTVRRRVCVWGGERERLNQPYHPYTPLPPFTPLTPSKNPQFDPDGEWQKSMVALWLQFLSCKTVAASYSCTSDTPYAEIYGVEGREPTTLYNNMVRRKRERGRERELREQRKTNQGEAQHTPKNRAIRTGRRLSKC